MIAGSCGGCDVRWTGLSVCHCSGCHETFGSVHGFDRHQIGDAVCLPVDAFAAIGLEITSYGRWGTRYLGKRPNVAARSDAQPGTAGAA